MTKELKELDKKITQAAKEYAEGDFEADSIVLDNIAAAFDDGASWAFKEAFRWRDADKELPNEGQEVLCKNNAYKEANTYYSDGVFDKVELRSRFYHWRPILMEDLL